MLRMGMPGAFVLGKQWWWQWAGPAKSMCPQPVYAGASDVGSGSQGSRRHAQLPMMVAAGQVSGSLGPWVVCIASAVAVEVADQLGFLSSICRHQSWWWQARSLDVVWIHWWWWAGLAYPQIPKQHMQIVVVGGVDPSSGSQKALAASSGHGQGGSNPPPSDNASRCW